MHLYQMNEYIAWRSFEGPDQPSQFPDAQALLDAGVYRLMDASPVVEKPVALATEHPQVRDFHYWAQRPRAGGVRVSADPVPGRPRDSAGERPAQEPARPGVTGS